MGGEGNKDCALVTIFDRFLYAFPVYVLSRDLSAVCQVTFDEIDVMKARYSSAAFDVIIIRSTFLHFPYGKKPPALTRAYVGLI